MDSDTLLVIGASTRALAQAAAADGLKVDAIDLFCDTDLKRVARRFYQSVDFPRDLVDIAAAIPISNWMYAGGIENYPLVVEAISCRHNLLGIDSQTLWQVRTVEALFELVPGPEIVTWSDLNRWTGQDWVLKPRRSGGGLGIKQATDKAQICLALSDDSHYLQRFVEGQSMSSLYLANGRQVKTLASFVSIGSTHNWIYQGSLGPVSLPPEQRDWTNWIGERIVEMTKLHGIFGVDWIRTPDGNCLVLEVNPRWTATAELCRRAFGFPLVRWHMDACQSGELPVLPDVGCCKPLSKRILYAPRDFVFHREALEQVERHLRRKQEFAKSDFEWCDLPAEGTQVPAAQPVCTLILNAPGVSLERLAKLVSHVSLE